MQTDPQYLVKILTAMRDHQASSMDSYDLADVFAVGIKSNKINDDALEKFVAHLRILHERGHINCSAKNLGFSQNINRHWIICRAAYQLTSEGNNFLDRQNESKLLSRLSLWFLDMLKEAIHKPLVWLILVGVVCAISWFLKQVFDIQLSVDDLLQFLTKREGV